MSKIRLLQVQMPVSEQVEKNLSAAGQAMETAASGGIDLVSLPEMFCCPYDTANFPLYAEETGGAVWACCSRLAKAYGIYLSAGSVPERGEDGAVYNTAYVFDRNGKQIAKHRKVHLFDIDVEGGQSFRESDTLTPGNSITTFDTEFGTLGLCICYDFRFPEMGRLMAVRGAKLLLVPAAFNPTTGPAHWEIMFRQRAVDNQCFMVGTSVARDEKAGYRAWGHSMAVSPWGDVIGELDEKPGCLIIKLDLGYVDKIRRELPLLNARRTDVYSLEFKGEK